MPSEVDDAPQVAPGKGRLGFARARGGGLEDWRGVRTRCPFLAFFCSCSGGRKKKKPYNSKRKLTRVELSLFVPRPARPPPHDARRDWNGVSHLRLALVKHVVVITCRQGVVEHRVRRRLPAALLCVGTGTTRSRPRVGGGVRHVAASLVTVPPPQALRARVCRCRPPSRSWMRMHVARKKVKPSPDRIALGRAAGKECVRAVCRGSSFVSLTRRSLPHLVRRRTRSSIQRLVKSRRIIFESLDRHIYYLYLYANTYNKKAGEKKKKHVQKDKTS